MHNINAAVQFFWVVQVFNLTTNCIVVVNQTVNTAARMESSGEQNKIHVSEKTAMLISQAGKAYVPKQLRRSKSFLPIVLTHNYTICGQALVDST